MLFVLCLFLSSARSCILSSKTETLETTVENCISHRLLLFSSVAILSANASKTEILETTVENSISHRLWLCSMVVTFSANVAIAFGRKVTAGAGSYGFSGSMQLEHLHGSGLASKGLSSWQFEISMPNSKILADEQNGCLCMHVKLQNAARQS